MPAAEGERPERTGRPGRWSVRVRVTALASLVVLAVLAVAGFAVVRAQERTLLGNLEEGLEQASADLVAAVQGETSGVVAGLGNDDVAYRVVDADGAVLLETQNVRGTNAFAGFAPDEGASTTAVDSLPFGDTRFLVRAEVVAQRAGPITVHVAAPLDDIDEAIAALRTSLLVAVPLITGVLAGMVWAVVGRSLRPVEAIRAKVAGIGGDQLDRRVPVPAGDDEVARLARTMNEMLGRIEVAAERQRRFVADASHELRTPLTRMRTELEVDLAHPGGADPQATHASVLAEVDGLQRLVDDLLRVARTDGPVAPGRAVALNQLVGDVAEATQRAATTTVTIDATLEPAVVTGDAEALRRLVANLVDNAVRHARERVNVTLRNNHEAVELTVADDGPGIPTADAERVFERFTRLDAARSQDAGGLGLGLAIVRTVADAHGGTVTVDTSYVDGARLVVKLPASTEAG